MANKRLGVLVLVLGGLAGVMAMNGAFSPPSNPTPEPAAATPGTEANLSPANDRIEVPPAEWAFISVVRKYAAAYQSGSNDMEKGSSRPARKDALEEWAKANSGEPKQWVGKISTLSSTNKGLGVLEIKLADGLTVGTTNNEFSDAIGVPTLIQPNTTVYRQAVGLHEGSLVTFGGQFAPGDSDFIGEESLTQEGSMTSPAFLMKFTSIELKVQ